MNTAISPCEDSQGFKKLTSDMQSERRRVRNQEHKGHRNGWYSQRAILMQSTLTD